MGRVGSIIAPGAKLCLAYAERLLNDVNPQNYAKFASPGGVVVPSNHPAFLLGHLSIYSQRIMQHLKQPLGPTEVPATYEALFKAGVECQNDPAGKIYPALDELKKHFFEGYRAAIAAVEAAPDEAFDPVNPVEGRAREMLPTIGAAINFYLIGHVQVHMGQISAWRRAMGMPAA